MNPFVVVHPTHILVHPRVHRAHRLKSAGLEDMCNFAQFYNIVFIIFVNYIDIKLWKATQMSNHFWEANQVQAAYKNATAVAFHSV